MKVAIRIVGIICAILVLMGLVFRMLHWPFASECTILGASLGAVAFIPMVATNNMVSNRTPLNIVTQAVGIVVGGLLLIGILVKIMSWPDNGFFGIGLIGAVFIFAPLYFINLAKNPHPFNLRTVLVLLFFGVLFYGSAKKTTRWLTFESIRNTSILAEQSLSQLSEVNAEYISAHQKIQKARQELLEHIAALRTHLISKTLEISPEEAQSLSNAEVWNVDEIEIPSQILVGKPATPNTGEFAAFELGKRLYEYGELLQSETGDSTSYFPTVNTFTFQGLQVSWEVQMFYKMPFIGVLNTLQQLELQVEVATAKALFELSSTSSDFIPVDTINR